MTKTLEEADDAAATSSGCRMGIMKLSEEHIAWCECRIVFETIRETLKVGYVVLLCMLCFLQLLKMDYEEDYLLSSKATVCYRVRLQNWSNVQCPWRAKDAPEESNSNKLQIGFDGLSALAIEVFNDSNWRLCIRSRKLREHIMATSAEEAQSYLGMSDILKGTVELIDGGAFLHYTASLSIDDMFSDLKTIAVQQVSNCENTHKR